MRRTIGGTLVSQILSMSRWGGPLSAFYELTQGVQAEQRPEMGRGKVLEESVLRMWCDRDGYAYKTGGRIEAEAMPHAHATLDALAWKTGPDVGGPHVVPDVKTVNRESMGEDWGEDGSDKIPTEYQCQLLWYVGVCRAAGMNVADEALLPALCGPEVELQWAARMVLKTGQPLALADLEGTGLEFRVYRVAWNETLFQEMDARVRRFLADHVEPGVPPAPGEGDLRERDMRAVSRGVRAESGRVLRFDDLDHRGREAVQSLAWANQQRKAWASEEEQRATRVKLLMGTAEEIVGVPGDVRVSWKDRADGTRVFQVREKDEEPRTAGGRRVAEQRREVPDRHPRDRG